MWKLCVIDDESNRTEVDLVRGEYSLGRAEESTVRLTERNISRSHARLFHDEDNQWWLEDKDSYTGSFVNGERVNGRATVQHGDTVQLGDYRLELSDSARQGESEASGPQEAAPLVDRFTIVQGPGVGTVHELTDQKLLIGRGEECRIALDDASVSRVHVEVLRTEHGLMILDQGSSNGLRINGAELPSAMLRGGDVVELGDVRLKFTPAGTEDVGLPTPGPVVEGTPNGAAQVKTSNHRGLLVSVAGIGLVAVLVFALAGGDEDVPSLATTRMGAEASKVIPEPDPAREALAEAKALAAKGSGVLAHRKLSGVPESSALRQTAEFLAIEKQWADELLKAASESPNREERETLYKLVSKTLTVGSEQRKAAAAALVKLESEVELKVVDVSELPTARSGSKATRPTPARSKPRERAPSKPKPRAAAKSQPSRPVAKATKPKPKPAAPPATKPAPKAKVVAKPVVKAKPAPVPPTVKPKEPSSSSPPELIRDNPF